MRFYTLHWLFLYLLLSFPFTSLNAQVQIGQSILMENEISISTWYVVAISGDGSRIVLSDPFVKDRREGGEVRVYERKGEEWVQIGESLVEKEEAKNIGYSISISDDGKVLALGGPNIILRDSIEQVGIARIYQEVDGKWIQMGEDILGVYPGDGFGRTISLSATGNRLAVGAYYDVNNLSRPENSGPVRVFEYTNGSWVQLGDDIKVSESSVGLSESWFPVSLNNLGTRIAIGAPFNENNEGVFSAGQVRVFELVDGAWIQLGQVLEGDFLYPNLGLSVELSGEGDILALGIELANVGFDINESGIVRAFRLENGTWEQMGIDIKPQIDTEFQQFGNVISLASSGERIAVGSMNSSGGNVQIFDWVDNNWLQTDQAISRDSESNEGYTIGTIAAISKDGSHVVVGGIGADNGQVRVFRLDSPTSLKPLFDSPQIHLSPNPFIENFTLKLESTEPINEVSIIDVHGKLVYHTSLKTGSSFVFNLSEISPGLYFLAVKTRSQLFTTKVIKE